MKTDLEIFLGKDIGVGKIAAIVSPEYYCHYALKMEYWAFREHFKVWDRFGEWWDKPLLYIVYHKPEKQMSFEEFKSTHTYIKENKLEQMYEKLVPLLEITCIPWDAVAEHNISERSEHD